VLVNIIRISIIHAILLFIYSDQSISTVIEP
jgi:hypothetical protein